MEPGKNVLEGVGSTALADLCPEGRPGLGRAKWTCIRRRKWPFGGPCREGFKQGCMEASLSTQDTYNDCAL